MRNLSEDTITQAVIASLGGCRDERLRTVMTSLVQHLHSFARETKLTEAEWQAAIGFLTAVGHITDDTRQEFILLSGVLGLSTLVTAQNHAKPAGCTEATVFGPFYVEGSRDFGMFDDIANGARGGLLRVGPCARHRRHADRARVAGSLASRRGRALRRSFRPTTARSRTARAAGCVPVPTAVTHSARSSPSRIRFRTTAPSARCSTRSAVIRGAPRTCTS